MLNRKVEYNFDLLTDIGKIQQFFEIERHPEKLSNEHVHQLGKLYNDRYPLPAQRNFIMNLFNPHTNHSFAKQMEIVDKENSYERWMLLADIIEKLPNFNGRLALTIINLFEAAFQKQISIGFRGGAHNDYVPIPRILMIQQLKQIANDHYLPKLVNLSELFTQLDRPKTPHCKQ